MRVIKNSETPKQAVNNPIFLGGAVTRQDLLKTEESKFFSFAVVNFSAGARNKFHRHSSDQVLFVTHGRGIVATEKEERVVTEGTTIHIPAGEKHWHGAAKDAAFSHITLTAANSKTDVLE